MALRDGRPDLFDLPRGWSMAPYPSDFVQRDGSTGPVFTCRACAQLRDARQAAGIRPLLSPSQARQAAIAVRNAESHAASTLAAVYELRRRGPLSSDAAEVAQPFPRMAT